MRKASTKNSSGTITIPGPLVRVGDDVMVPNYRKPDQVEELGRVMWVKCDLERDGSVYWSYTIGLERKSKAGRRLVLQVSDTFCPPRRAEVRHA